jgi:hypothetical protein
MFCDVQNIFFSATVSIQTPFYEPLIKLPYLCFPESVCVCARVCVCVCARVMLLCSFGPIV